LQANFGPPAFPNKSRSERLVTNFVVLEGFEGYDPGLSLNPLLCVSVWAGRAVGLIISSFAWALASTPRRDLPVRRLWASVAGARPHSFPNAICGAIRLKLLKPGALVKISVRRVKIAFASARPNE